MIDPKVPDLLDIMQAAKTLMDTSHKIHGLAKNGITGRTETDIVHRMKTVRGMRRTVERDAQALLLSIEKWVASLSEEIATNGTRP